MANEWLEIEQLAANAKKGVSTVRKHLKDLSQGKKDLYIKKIQLEGKGGIKHLYHKNLITILFSSDRDDNDVIETAQNEGKSHEQNEPKQPQNENVIIELLREQLAIKDAQISDLSHTNKELLERLKEVNYTLANAQKQLAAPVDNEQTTPPKWWQFWK